MTSDKNAFFTRINEAFVKNDTAYIAANITEDVQWTMVGSPPIHGKSAFIEAMASAENESLSELKTQRIITHGNMAAVEGTMKMVDKTGAVRDYAFCDIYRLDGLKNDKIKEITSYVIETAKQDNTK